MFGLNVHCKKEHNGIGVVKKRKKGSLKCAYCEDRWFASHATLNVHLIEQT